MKEEGQDTALLHFFTGNHATEVEVTLRELEHKFGISGRTWHSNMINHATWADDLPFVTIFKTESCFLLLRAKRSVKTVWVQEDNEAPR